MKPENFEQYIRRLYAGLQSLQNVAIRTAEAEAVHDMRVQIKRLSCIYTFLEESKIAPVKKDKYYSDLRNYFKTAGKLREFQLHRKMIDGYKQQYGDHFIEYEEYNNSQGRFYLDFFNRNRGKLSGTKEKSIRTAILLAVKNADEDHLKKAGDSIH